MHSQQIKQQIAEHIQCQHLEVDGDGNHFQAVVVSDEFIGKSRVRQQQMVYACVQPWLTSGELHALSLKTFTITEWQANG